MTNGKKKVSYFCLGTLTAILAWLVYTLYYIFSKPVLPTNVVDEDAEYQACLKKYAEAVMSLERKQQIPDPPPDEWWSGDEAQMANVRYHDHPHSLDDTQPIRIGVTETIMPEVIEVSENDLRKWAEESE